MGRSPVGCVRTSLEIQSLIEQGVQLYYVSSLGRLCVVETLTVAEGRVRGWLLTDGKVKPRRAELTQSTKTCGLDKNHSRTERAGYFFSTPEAAVRYAGWIKEGVRLQRESAK